MKLYRNENGEKMYPVCKWQNAMHKFEYAQVKADLACVEYEGTSNEELDRLEAELDKINNLIELAEAYIINGMIYATWSDGQEMKKYIGTYNSKHSMYR